MNTAKVVVAFDSEGSPGELIRSPPIVSEGAAVPLSPLSTTFGTELCFDPDQIILRVDGEVDMLTAPAFGALMGAVVERGHSALVLDLARLTFMDASGLGAIANTLVRLGPLGGTITIRSAPAAILRLLEISGMSALVRFDADEDLTSDLARMGSMPLSDRIVDAALQLVTTLAAATIEGADGVSVSLDRLGRLATIAASNRTVRLMDDHQYETGEGPCVAAAAEGRTFHIESLHEERRWPAFVPRAVEEGIASILSTPLMAAERPLGALNIYSNKERVFGAPQRQLASLFATQAAGVLVDAGVDMTRELLSQRVTSGLRARETIAQAQGIVMARRHLAAESAAADMFREARDTGVSVLELAARIVASAVDDG